ncbi:MAG: type pilus assembly protein PilB [Patescibacteria group bacterium]|nr:type pilus assembly protein PilB [Bacillota bacterium]MDQ5957256.1 type pilus assembly protein PilB [Patescibacteria group bacterium]
MQTLNELLKRGIINDLIYRDVSQQFKNGSIKNIDETLSKYIDVSIINKIRAEIFSLEEFSSQEIIIEKDFENIFNSEDLRKYKIIPLSPHIVGVYDPEILNLFKFINDKLFPLSLDYKIQLISKQDFEKGLELFLSLENEADTTASKKNEEKYYDSSSEIVMSDVSRAAGSPDKKEAEDITESRINLDDYKGNLEDIPIEKLVNSFVYEAIEKEASDIHIEHHGNNMVIKFRVDGVLHTMHTLRHTMHQPIVARIKILSDLKLDEKRKPQDGRFSIRIKNGESNHKIDFRVSSMPAYYGEKIVIRILDSYKGVRNLESIGFSKMHLTQIRKALEKPYGMIIISGPTGSGKTTTLYSMLNEIDRETKNVVSLEDPIEYNVPNMNQSQIFPEIGYTFATGLRSILRQDPDVIMVGEIRDKETAELAIQAALTGHLVFSTIHTNNSIGVITRLKDMGVDPYLIAPTIILSIAQRLTPLIHPSCASPIEMTPAIKNMITEEFKDLDEKYKNQIDLNRPFYEAVPNTGYTNGTKGRVPVLEMIEIDDDIQNAILSNISEDDLFKIARSKGMITMKEDAMLKSMDKKVPFVEIAGL